MAKPSNVKVINQTFGRNWAAYNADCIEGLRGLPDNSIGYFIFSPPFEDFMTYSRSNHDLGNSRNPDEFYTHFRFMVKEAYRTLMPGRNLSFHVRQIPMTMGNQGQMGLVRCKDKMCDLFEEEGFVTYDEKIIWKDPVVEQQRTHALGLLHKQVISDSARCRSGLHDYLVTMQKPGKNPQPVVGCFDAYYGTDRIPGNAEFTTYNDSYNSFSIEVWQRYASSVWMDINPGDTIDGEKGRKAARDPKDEKHVCPLQLTVIRRSLQLYSNPDDIVCTPFGGIGSEGVCAVEMKRKAILFELKESYFKQLVKNMKKAAGDEFEQKDLFSIESAA